MQTPETLEKACSITVLAICSGNPMLHQDAQQNPRSDNHSQHMHKTWNEPHKTTQAKQKLNRHSRVRTAAAAFTRDTLAHTAPHAPRAAPTTLQQTNNSHAGHTNPGAPVKHTERPVLALRLLCLGSNLLQLLHSCCVQLLCCHHSWPHHLLLCLLNNRANLLPGSCH